VEIAVGAGADGSDDASGVGIAGKDGLGVGLEGVELAGEIEAVEAVAALAGKDEVIGPGTEALQRFTSPIGVPDGAILALKEAHQEVVDGAIGVD
jgi:hypothetical protein